MLLLLLACADESADESAGIALSADDESTKLTIAGARFSLTSGDGVVSRAACPVAADCVTRESERWTEWWSPLARGWEQGFTVPDRGSLVEIPVRVDGATVTATGPRTAKLTVGDTTLRYTGLRAWEARHHDWPAALAVRGNQITLRVDTRDAEFPVVVDPAVVTDWQVGGAETGGALGDINDEGFGDVATVDYDYHSSRYYWTTTVYLGADGGPSETGTDCANSYSSASSTFIGGVAPAGVGRCPFGPRVVQPAARPSAAHAQANHDKQRVRQVADHAGLRAQRFIFPRYAARVGWRYNASRGLITGPHHGASSPRPSCRIPASS